MTDNIRGIRANHIYMEDNEVVDGRDVLAGVMAHPVHSILHELQVVLMSELPDEKRAAQLNHKVVSVMAYIESLENNISMMKDDVNTILDRHGNKIGSIRFPSVESILEPIRTEINNL